MKIVTINVPVSYIEAIEKLVDTDHGLYLSRSELIRVAVRKYLLKQLNTLKRNIKRTEEEEAFDDENFVRVPVEDRNGKEPVTEFKTYKIIKRLEHA